MATTARTITAQARRDVDAHLELVKGDGYCYWVYDAAEANIFETESVYVPRISDLTVSAWLDHARDLVDFVNEERK